MRKVVCRHCQQSVEVPDDLAHAHCVRCGQPLAPVETQITAKPSAVPPQGIQPIDQFERFGTESGSSPRRAFTDWDDFRATSEAVQNELLELARRPMPDLRRVYLRPLPAKVTAAIEGWRAPLGTIEAAGEDWLYFWFVASSSMFIGVIGVLAGIITLGSKLAERRQDMPLGQMLFVFAVMVGVLAWSLWYIFVRGRKMPYTLWVFEEGLFWKVGRRMNASLWKDVLSFRVGNNPASFTPIVWLGADERTKFTITMDNSPALMPLVEFMEIRLTAAQLLPRLEQIFTGHRVTFGAVALNRSGLAGPRFFAPWHEIRRVVRDRERLFVDLTTRKDWYPIPYALVSFPLVVMAIAHILIAEEKMLNRNDA